MAQQLKASMEDILLGLVRHILQTEDYASAVDWMCEPQHLAALMPPESTAETSRSAAVMLARAVWNVTPLPSNRFRPRPLPRPQRNAPCPCGSGLKYKHCCHDLPLPEIPADHIWLLALEILDDEQLRQALQVHAVPPVALLGLAQQYLDAGNHDGVESLLEPLFESDLHKLDAQHEEALDILCDAYLALGHADKKAQLLQQLTEHASPPLQAAAWQRLATVRMDQDDSEGAWQAFQHAQRIAPEHLALSTLEVMLLAGEGRLREASDRADFWLGRMRPDAPPELLDFLANAAANPEETLTLPGAEDNAAAVQRLTACVANMQERPVPDYAVTDESGNDEPLAPSAPSLGPADDSDDEQPALGLADGDLDEPGEPLQVLAAPAGLDGLEQHWHELFPADKPISTYTESFADSDPWAPEHAEDWLQLLEQNPAFGDSIDIIDDLVTALHLQPMSPDAERLCYAPLLQRAIAILDQALAKAPADVELNWLVMHNRPLLRLLHNYTMLLYDNDEQEAAQARMWQYLRLNPNDNHGLRQLLANEYLRAGADQEMLALCARYPNDFMPELAFGAVLAHYRQGDHAAATKALHHAQQCNQHIIPMLVQEHVPQPELSEYGIRVGGEDQAWLYRAEMRDVWTNVDGLLDWVQQAAGMQQ